MGSKSSQPTNPSYSKPHPTLKPTGNRDNSGSHLECRSQKKTYKDYDNFNIHHSKSKLSRAAKEDSDSIFRINVN